MPALLIFLVLAVVWLVSNFDYLRSKTEASFALLKSDECSNLHDEIVFCGRQLGFAQLPDKQGHYYRPATDEIVSLSLNRYDECGQESSDVLASVAEAVGNGMLNDVEHTTIENRDVDIRRVDDSFIVQVTGIANRDTGLAAPFHIEMAVGCTGMFMLAHFIPERSLELFNPHAFEEIKGALKLPNDVARVITQ